MREELLGLTVEVGPTGAKVVDRGKVHQDFAVAVRGVVAALTGAAIDTPILAANWGGSVLDDICREASLVGDW